MRTPALVRVVAAALVLGPMGAASLASTTAGTMTGTTAGTTTAGTATAVANDTSVTVPAAADTSLHAAEPTRTSGASSLLEVEGSPEVVTLLRFGLPAAPAGHTLARARLQLSTTDVSSAGSTDALRVHEVAGSWTEASTTYATRPALSAPVVGRLPGPTAPARRYTIELDPEALRAELGAEASLALASTGDDRARVASREATATTTRPALVLDFASTPASSPATTAVSVPVTADSYVHASQRTTAFGGSQSLAAYGTPDVWSLLRFRLPEAPTGQVLTRATLRLTTTGLASAGSVDTLRVRRAADTWAEATVTHATRPAVEPADVGVLAGPTAPSRAYAVPLDVARVAPRLGTSDTLALTSTGTDSWWLTSREAPTTTARPVLDLQFAATASAPAVVMAVGDIACQPGSVVAVGVCQHAAVADVVRRAAPDRFVALGDIQYPTGSYEQFTGTGGYDSAFGDLKARTLPVLGNHEYTDPAGKGTGYFDYFYGKGVATGPFGARPDGWYAAQIGTWRFLALNSECAPDGPNDGRYVTSGCGPGSPQYEWVRAQLATAPRCTVVAFHRPRWTTGTHGSYAPMAPLWDLMAGAGVDVVLTGHNHDSEVFRPIGASGSGTTPVQTADGIRSFVAGGGGKSLRAFPSPSPAAAAALQARDATTFGPLRLVLHDGSFDWRFEPLPGQTFTGASTTGAFSGTGESCR